MTLQELHKFSNEQQLEIRKRGLKRRSAELAAALW
jgi:hypothetical protein